MSLVTVPGKIRPCDHHAFLIMTEGSQYQAVCIADDAMPVGAGDAMQDLVQFLDIYEDIADRKFNNGELAYDGLVWITSSDIKAH